MGYCEHLPARGASRLHTMNYLESVHFLETSSLTELKIPVLWLNSSSHFSLYPHQRPAEVSSSPQIEPEGMQTIS